MACVGKESLETAEATFKDAGFTVSQLCLSRPSCFDFAARREKKLILVKLQPDIGNVTLNDAQEFRLIATDFSAASLLIGEKAREKPLEEDTIYRRYNILAVTPKTFENVVLHDVPPLIQASPGGYYVEIDAEALRQRRQELGLSVGEIAEMVGISRRTVYGYERGMAKASVLVAYNLIGALGIPVARAVDIFQPLRAHRKQRILTAAKHVFARNRFLNIILRKLAPFHVTAVRKAPFDFVLSVPGEKLRIIGGFADEKESGLRRRVEEILSVCRVVKARAILIADGPKPEEKGIPCFSPEEFSRIKDPEDFITNFRQSSSDADPFRL